MNELLQNKIVRVVIIQLAMIACYLVILPMWPVITSTAFSAANTVNASANAHAYRATIGGLRFAPLALIITPAAISTVATYITLKFSKPQGG